VIAEADGESQRFLSLLGEYQKAPEVTRERLYLETVEKVFADSNKVLLDTDNTNNLTYLPLDRMVQPSRVTDDTPSPSPRIALPSPAEQNRSTPFSDRRSFDRSRRER